MKNLIILVLSLSMTAFAKTEKSMSTQTAYLAGGCFWGMEELVRSVPGVISTEVGYTGGNTGATSYELVKTGTTNQAESLKVEFDPKKLTYAKLLEFFFRIHDPTTINQQGNDRGTQYRSAIFYTTPEQELIAKEVKEKVNASGKWKSPVVTEITKFGQWAKAEDYHQDYLQKHPNGYTCHWVRP